MKTVLPTRPGPELVKEMAGQLPTAVRKLDPRLLWHNPVLFVVWIGSLLTTVAAVAAPDGFTITVTVFLWLTVLFGTLAEAVAERRGRAHVDSLKAVRDEAVARLVDADGEREVPATSLEVGDVVRVAAGEVVPGDGDVIDGVASVDESVMTGESAPVIREAGGDRSAVTGGTTVLSDELTIRIGTTPGETFLDKMISLVAGTSRRRTPNEIALNTLLVSLTLVLLVSVSALPPIAARAGLAIPLPAIIALLVCLIPTTIGALLSAIGIAGMERLLRVNVLAMSGRAVEAAGDVSTLLLDKTGTITLGNRRAVAVRPLAGVDEATLMRAALAASSADQTPEGRSIVELARAAGAPDLSARVAATVEFSAQTRMSGVDLHDGTQVRKGAISAVSLWCHGDVEEDRLREARDLADEIGALGATPLAVAIRDARGTRLLGLVHLKDVVKPGLADRFRRLRAMGIRTVMVTGDNRITAAAIAQEAGVDDVLAEATPEDKLAYIRKEQEGGRLVAMTGDGTNDAPALAAADVGVAMQTGTAAAKEAGNMVDLDSDPTKLIDIVVIGKQLIITRGALTTFSVANDLAKYFAILPALFAAAYPGLAALNVMHLGSANSAIVSAVVFNALIIPVLVPLALRGVKVRATGAADVLRRNLLLYGVGGVLAPFVGIKLIDLLVSALPWIG